MTMTIEVALLFSAVSLAFGIYSGVANLRRNTKQDAKTNATQLTTVIVKLENIGQDINQIKMDLRDTKLDIKDHSSRLIRVEQQVEILNNAIFKKDGKDDEK